MIIAPAPTGIAAQDQINLTVAFKRAASLGQAVALQEGVTYQVTDGLTVSYSAGVPRGIECNGATIFATVKGSIPLSICNPHSVREHFFVRDLTIEGNNQAVQCLNITGMQYASLSNLRLLDATSICFQISGGKGFGVYYNSFNNVICRGSGWLGWRWADNLTDYAAEGSHIQGNKISCCQVQNCTGGGTWLTGVQGSLSDCQIEGNGNVGLLLDNSIQFDMYSVYFENNFVNGTDTAIQIDDTTAKNIRRYGGQWDGRIIGTVT